MIPTCLPGLLIAPANRSGTQSLLLHFNGANGSSTFTDSSANARVPAVAGGSVLSTAQKKFGSASGAFLGTNDEITFSNFSGLNFGLGDYLVHGFFRFNALASQNQILQMNASGNAYPIVYTVGTQLRFFQGGLDRAVGGSLAAGTWYHFALTRQGGNTKFFLDGGQLGSTLAGDTTDFTSAIVRLGAVPGFRPCDGWIDEFEVLKDEAGLGVVPTGEIATR
jgi:hypothetical protein